MSDREKSTAPDPPDEHTTPMERLRERQRYIADIRADLLSGKTARRTEGLRRLYVELAESGEIWFDRLGHVATVDNLEGFEAGLVELVLCLGFDDWPADTLAPPPGSTPPPTAPAARSCSASN